MAIYFHQDLASVDWVIEAGTIMELDPFTEDKWVRAGHAMYISEAEIKQLEEMNPLGVVEIDTNPFDRENEPWVNVDI